MFWGEYGIDMCVNFAGISLKFRNQVSNGSPIITARGFHFGTKFRQTFVFFSWAASVMISQPTVLGPFPARRAPKMVPKISLSRPEVSHFGTRFRQTLVFLVRPLPYLPFLFFFQDDLPKKGFGPPSQPAGLPKWLPKSHYRGPRPPILVPDSGRL